MNYTVIWTHRVMADVTRIHVHLRNTTGNVTAVPAAITEFEDQLSRDPYSVGESREFGVRIGFAAPLAIRYEVHDTDHVVVIFEVRYFARHHS